ncbi:MAG: O-antigen ligase family protein [Putridiphycobacter sp.]|nr:O-antigen ligase family protein [Putridiphycobacter sp.]
MKTVQHNASFLRKINIFLISIVVFFVPFNLKIIAPAIALFTVSSLVLILKEKLAFQLDRNHLLLFAFYLFLVVGVFWSNNFSAAVFDLEVKMSLFIFPILFSFIRYSKNQLIIIFKVFIFSVLLVSVVLLQSAIGRYWQSGSVDTLFYVNLSPRVHPSYLSLYTVTGLGFLFLGIKEKQFRNSWQKVVAVTLSVYFFVFNILLLSKIGIIASVLLVLIFIGNYMIKTKKVGLGIFVLAVMYTFMYMSFQKSPYLKQRVNEFTVGLTASEGKSSSGSTGIRLKIWKNAVALIKEKPFLGYGTGDVKDVLVKSYHQSGYTEAYKKKLNAHNQFLQVSIALGIFGLLLFLSIFGFYIYDSILSENLNALLFIIIAIIFMIPESVLENQAGTIFFGLFFALLNQKSTPTQ